MDRMPIGGYGSESKPPVENLKKALLKKRLAQGLINIGYHERQLAQVAPAKADTGMTLLPKRITGGKPDTGMTLLPKRITGGKPDTGMTLLPKRITGPLSEKMSRLEMGLSRFKTAKALAKSAKQGFKSTYR